MRRLLYSLINWCFHLDCDTPFAAQGVDLMPLEKEEPKTKRQRINKRGSAGTSSNEELTHLCQHLQGMTTNTTA